MGFRPVTLSEVLDDKMGLAPGASPVVFTFDDSDESQFRTLADHSVDPNCAVGIWMAFAKQHPDFPVKACFYVLPPVPWGQRATLIPKLKMLKEWGCELGSHTITHRSLAKLSSDQVKEELSKAQEFIRGWSFDPFAIALPLGISPKDKSLLKSFTLNGKTYRHEAVLLVGAGPAPSPEDPKFDPFRLPRIQAIEGEYGITYWLDRIHRGLVSPYVAP